MVKNNFFRQNFTLFRLTGFISVSWPSCVGFAFLPVLSGFSDFLPHSKTMHSRLKENSKLSPTDGECESLFVNVCPVQLIGNQFRLYLAYYPKTAWERLQHARDTQQDKQFQIQ